MKELRRVRYSGCLVSMDLRRLTKEASIIVVGDVEKRVRSFEVTLSRSFDDTAPQLEPPMVMVFTEHRIAIRQFLKPGLLPDFTPMLLPVFTFGGRTREFEARVDGEAELRLGETAVLFLTTALVPLLSSSQPLPPAAFSVLAGYQGKRSVLGEEPDRRVQDPETDDSLPFYAFVSAVQQFL